LPHAQPHYRSTILILIHGRCHLHHHHLILLLLLLLQLFRHREISGSHGGEYEDDNLLEYSAV
jgi:hypothetical protein